MTDELINAHNLPSENYKEKKVGPRLVVHRENDFNFIIDEIETIVSEKDSPFPGKELKTGKDVLIKLANKTHGELVEGVVVSYKDGEKLLECLELIGVRALRDYKFMTILIELLRKHYSGGEEVEHNIL